MLEGRPIEPTLMGYENDYSNEFMCLSWEEEFEDETVFIEVVFIEGDNTRAEIDGCVLTLINSTGDPEQITLLKEFYAEQA